MNKMVSRRILIVDDEENVAWTLQEGLSILPDCEVVTATSGEQALALFKQQPFDLVITDYRMPGINGLTLAKHIKTLKPKTAIVMITAYADDVCLNDSLEVLLRHILNKPVNFVEIRRASLEALEFVSRLV